MRCPPPPLAAAVRARCRLVPHLAAHPRPHHPAQRVVLPDAQVLRVQLAVRSRPCRFVGSGGGGGGLGRRGGGGERGTLPRSIRSRWHRLPCLFFSLSGAWPAFSLRFRPRPRLISWRSRCGACQMTTLLRRGGQGRGNLCSGDPQPPCGTDISYPPLQDGPPNASTAAPHPKNHIKAPSRPARGAPFRRQLAALLGRWPAAHSPGTTASL